MPVLISLGGGKKGGTASYQTFSAELELTLALAIPIIGRMGGVTDLAFCIIMRYALCRVPG